MKKILLVVCLSFFSPFLGAKEPSFRGTSLEKGIYALGEKLETRLSSLDENVVLSPYNLYLTLSLVQLGARGETENVFSKLLETSTDSLPLLSLSIQNLPEGVTSFQSIWVQDQFPLEPLFSQFAKKHFQTNLETAPFLENPSLALSNINQFVEEKSRGLIKQLFDQSQIDETTRLVLASVLHLKKEFKFPFSPIKTEEGIFSSSEGTEIFLPFMKQDVELPYFEGEDFELVEIPYKDSPLVLWIFLPKGEKLTETLEEKWHQLIASPLELTPTYLRLKMPKIEISSAFSLKQTLVDLGLGLAFNNEANFSGITPQPIRLSAVEHQSVIRWDETGTEASAATGVIGVVRSYPKGIPFVINKPFFFQIFDREQGIPFFMGHVTTPKTWGENRSNEVVF